MEITLRFIDTPSESKNGIVRGVVAIVILLLICFVWYGFVFVGWRKYIRLEFNSRSVIACFIFLFLLSSAICVSHPPSATVALAYGALVGLVVAGTSNAFYVMANKKYPLSMAVLDTVFGVVLASFTSWVIFKIFKP